MKHLEGKSAWSLPRNTPAPISRPASMLGRYSLTLTDGGEAQRSRLRRQRAAVAATEWPTEVYIPPTPEEIAAVAEVAR